MMTECPTAETWVKLLREDVPAPDLEGLEGHLERCDSCSRALEVLAGIESIADRGTPTGGRALGRGSLAMLARMAAAWPAEADRPPADADPIVPPDVPGLVDWEVVGKGGMGVVFRAREVDLDRPVAVKVLSSSGRLAPSARVRAIREALLMASLRHPNVVQVHRSGQVGGVPFLMMEWAGGGTLQGRIEAGLLSPREAAETVRDLARAVGEAHALGIIHRDLKPDNVLLAPTAGTALGFVPKLTDFGIALRGDTKGLTEAGAVLGTPGYMAPEQTGHERAVGEVGPATDIHGLGAILYASLTGLAPYAGQTSWESMIRAARGTPPSVRDRRRDVPLDLATIVAKCLQSSPGRRYRSAGELADDLGRFLEGRPISARATSAPERLAKWSRRHPALAASASLLVVAVVGAVAGTAYHVASIDRAFRDLADEQGKTREALASATSARDRARHALGSLTDDAVQRMLKRGDALNDADRDYLRKLRIDYEEWPLEPDPVAALKFRASGLGRIGDIFDSIEQDEDARLCREAAVLAYDEAQRRGADGPELVEARVKAMGQLHVTLEKSHKPAEAEAVARKMIAARESLVGGCKEFRLDSAWDYFRLGGDLADQGRNAEAEESFLVGMARVKEFRLQDPQDLVLQEDEQWGCHNLGIVYLHSGRKGDAEAIFRKMIGLTEASLAANPAHEAFAELQVRGLDEIAESIRDDRPAEALAFQRRRLKALGDLIARFPDNKGYRGDLIFAANQTYYLLADLGRPGEAEADLERAIEDGQRLVQAEPAIYRRSSVLMYAVDAYASMFQETGRPRRAVEQWDRLATICTPWTRSKTWSPEVLDFLIGSRRDSAELLSELGEHAEAARRLSLALDLCEPKERPRLHLEIARELLDAGDHPGARAAAERAAASPETAPEAAKLLAQMPKP